nr:hypothetical protein [Tanacetum cinerariifolium]
DKDHGFVWGSGWGVVCSWKKGRKKEENVEFCLGGKHCSLHSVLKGGRQGCDDQSSSDEDVLEKIVSKPLSEEEVIPMESLRTHDSSLSILSKIDSLLDEFAGELTLLKSILPGIDETDCDFEEDIRLIEKLLYDNSSSRPSKEFVSANSDAASESFSPSHILVKDSDSLMEEIDLFCTPDYPMLPSIVDKDYDSERDILIPKDLPSNNSLSFAEKERNLLIFYLIGVELSRYSIPTVVT